jgi:type II secretory pathway pseudopilin PulG
MLLKLRQRIRSARHRQRQLPGHTESGITLLEALIAIIVVGLTVSAITPAFVLAVATRVQTQKADQAIQLANRETSNARLIMELAPLNANGNEDILAQTEDSETVRQDFLPADLGNTAAVDVAAPTTFLALTDAKCNLGEPDKDKKPAAGEACSVDVDNDGKADFAVQAFRVNTRTANNGGSIVGFDMGVRVYSYDATGDPDDDGKAAVTVSNLTTETGSLGLTTKPGVSANNSSRLSPMAVVYTSILRGERDNSLCDFLELQGLTAQKLTDDYGMECDQPPAEPEGE